MQTFRATRSETESTLRQEEISRSLTMLLDNFELQSGGSRSCTVQVISEDPHVYALATDQGKRVVFVYMIRRWAS